MSFVEAVFDSAGVILSQEIVPKSPPLARKSREICQRILSTSSRTKQNARHHSTKLAIEVAKFGDLQHDRYGDFALPSDTISCTPRYAKRII